MQFKVPQNIDMQDKIIGPLTLVQFFYLLFGGIVIYILFNDLAPLSPFIFWIIALPLGVFSFAMAFLKVQDRPFPTFIMAMIKYLAQPRTRVWQHYVAPVANKPKPVVTSKDKNARRPRKVIDSLQVDQLAELLDEPLPREDRNG